MSPVPRLHIVGSSPRSGTTLMFELLTACYDIEKFGVHEISIFASPDAPTRAFASKSPTDFIHVVRVLRWKPTLHCIYMERDPRDIIVSEHGKRPGEYWCDFRVWRRNYQLLRRIRGHSRIMVCKYEELVTDPDALQARIEAAFPFLRRTHDFSRFEEVSGISEDAAKALKGIRAISPDSIGKWRNHLPRVAAQLEAEPNMPDLLIEADYETDRAWTALCDSVTPDRRSAIRTAQSRFMRYPVPLRQLMRGLQRLRTLSTELRYILSPRV